MASDGRSARELTVLVVDDEPMMQRVLTRIIASDDTLRVVGVAADAEEAVEMAAAHHPDVALVDVGIPKGSGVYATREMLSRSPSTRVIALSGHDDREHITQMLGAGAQGYLVKGVDVDVLRCIRSAANGDVVLSRDAAAHMVSALTDRLAAEEQQQVDRRLRSAEIEAVLSEGRFHMVYQPIFHLRRSAVVGVEALARFDTQPTRPPDEWVRQAWELGLGVELELALISAAITGAGELRPDLYLAVNVTPPTALSNRFLDLMQGVPRPEQMVVELTESWPVEDYDVLNEHLSGLRAKGIRLAVDDAGAGYASLRHVLKMRPDLIKLDVSLVSDVEHNPAQRALAWSLVGFATEVGSVVVAEGLETPDQVAYLRDLGVVFGQGNAMAEPLGDLDLLDTAPGRRVHGA